MHMAAQSGPARCPQFSFCPIHRGQNNQYYENSITKRPNGPGALIPLRLQIGPQGRFNLRLEDPIDPAVLVNCEFPVLLEKLVVYVDDKKGAARLAIPLRCDAFFSQILSAFVKM